MSVLRLARNCGNFAKLFNSNSTKLTSFSSVVGKKVNFAPSQRHFSLTLVKLSEEEEEEPAREKKAKTDRDRSTKHSVETSIEYLNSDAYQTTYGGKLVWDGYIRINKRGANNKLAPRKSCIYGDAVTVASPCPVCRDEYLILDHRNIDLLKQFISPYTGRVESNYKTGLCMKQQRNLLIALERAYDLGTITFPVGFREYDYSLYYKKPDADDVDDKHRAETKEKDKKEQ